MLNANSSLGRPTPKNQWKANTQESGGIFTLGPLIEASLHGEGPSSLLLLTTLHFCKVPIAQAIFVDPEASKSLKRNTCQRIAQTGRDLEDPHVSCEHKPWAHCVRQTHQRAQVNVNPISGLLAITGAEPIAKKVPPKARLTHVHIPS